MTNRKYTRAMHDLAHELYARDEAAGTLKPPMAIAVQVSLSDGHRRLVSAMRTTYEQYLPEARRATTKGA